MSQRQRCDVLVAGAGPVGCAVALMAARAGFDTVLVDPRGGPDSAEMDDIGLRVSALSPGSQALLESLGVWQPERLRAQPYRSMEVWEDRPSHGIAFHAESVGQPVLGHIVPNGRLRRSLWEAVQQQARLTVLETAIEALSCGASRREVSLADASQWRARLVLAADGARSETREQLGIAVAVHDYAQSAVVAHLELEQDEGDVARQRFIDGQPIGLLPLQERQLSVVWSTDNETAESLTEMDEATFLLRFSEALGDAAPAVSKVFARARFPLRRQRARRLISERAALLGDAAGSVHPLAGQGLNLGLADVVRCGELLARAAAEGADPGAYTLLRRYERSRRAERAGLDAGIHGLQRLFAVNTPGISSIRSLGLQLVDRATPLKHALARRALG